MILIFKFSTFFFHFKEPNGHFRFNLVIWLFGTVFEDIRISIGFSVNGCWHDVGMFVVNGS